MIPVEYLERVRGKILFYPCSGRDWVEPVEVFAPYVDEFWFCDLNYDSDQHRIEKDNDAYRLIRCEPPVGDPASTLEEKTEDRPYRDIKPCIWRAHYEHRPSGRCLVINWRKGFGQIALSEEFDNRSIGVFIHRGDSPGEGGSNAYFFANRNAKHEPLRNLFNKLAKKLTDPALVVSDGSNCDFGHLKQWHGKSN